MEIYDLKPGLWSQSSVGQFQKLSKTEERRLINILSQFKELDEITKKDKVKNHVV